MSSLPLAFAYSKHPLSVSHIFCGNWVRRGFDGRSIVQTIDRPGVRHCFRPLLLRQGKRVARKAIITEVDRTLGGIGKESDYNLNEILIKSTTIRPLPSISSLIHLRKSRAKPSPETIDPFLFLASSFEESPGRSIHHPTAFPFPTLCFRHPNLHSHLYPHQNPL